MLTSGDSYGFSGPSEQTEALLAVLAEVVGIGDAFGRTDIDLVNHLCLEDGTLVQPDAPAIPVEACVTGEADEKGLPLLTQASTTFGANMWWYLLSMDLGDTRQLSTYSMGQGFRHCVYCACDHRGSGRLAWPLSLLRLPGWPGRGDNWRRKAAVRRTRMLRLTPCWRLCCRTGRR